jgi:hypothetical protein
VDKGLNLQGRRKEKAGNVRYLSYGAENPSSLNPVTALMD